MASFALYLFGLVFSFAAGTLVSSYIFYTSLDSVGVLTAVPSGASSAAGFNDLAQNKPSYTVKYATWVYSASSRRGSAVYINGLVRQFSPDDLAAPLGRTVYLQRYIGGGWQTMLSRPTNRLGQFVVGFVQRSVVQYRLVATETSTAWTARSASTFR